MQRSRSWRTTALIFASATAFQFGGCGLDGALAFAGNLNPCGTVLNCDPVEYAFLASGYEGPGVDFSVDPTCTFPPLCGPNAFTPAPPAGGGAP